MKYQKNNLSELINKYIEPDVESQQLESQVIESGIDSHLKNWELEIDNLEKDLPIQMLSSIRQVLQENQQNAKRSKSVQSSFKYGMDNQSMKQTKDNKSNNLSHSINKKESTISKEQKQFKEVGIPQQQQKSYENCIREQSEKKNLQRAQSVQDSRGQNGNYCYKIFPEWNGYPNNLRASRQSQSNMSQRELNNQTNIMQNQVNSLINQSQFKRGSFGICSDQMQQYDSGNNIDKRDEIQKKYLVNQRQSNDENDLINSQQKQRLKNGIYRSQSTTQLKDSYLNNMAQLIDIPIDQSHLIKTQPLFNINVDLNQNLQEQKRLSQQSQMLEYIQNSDKFQKPQNIKSVNEILQIPANQLKQSENIRSCNNIQSSQEKRQYGTQRYYLNYNKSHMSQLNKSNINKTDISQQLPQKYQILMQGLQKPHTSQIYKSQVNTSNWEINYSSSSQIISSYKNIHHTQRDNSQRSRKKIFEEYSATSYIQNVKDSYNRIFPRKN
ncbi:hypothetical protein ABPG72_002249 [Tetrahymena utriculariae]